MATVVDSPAASLVTQRFHSEVHSESHSRSQRVGISTPDGDLRDVEADFQSLVNEMVQEGSKRSQVMTSSSSQSFSQSMTTMSSKSSKSQVSSTNSHIISPNVTPASGESGKPLYSIGGGVVTAVPARVIPEPDPNRGGGQSEVVVEKPMRVRDRVKKLEKSLSQEGAEPPAPPEVILPRTRSGSIKNLAEQFEHHEEGAHATSVNASAFSGVKDALECTAEARSVREIASSFSQRDENVTSNKVEGQFKSVKEVATKFQEPITPITIKPPPVFTDADQPSPVEPVAVLPPAMRRVPATRGQHEAEVRPAVSVEEHKRDTLEEVSRYSETLSQASTERRSTSAANVVQQPIQYSAQVKCEVRSRVSTPDIEDQQITEATRKTRGECSVASRSSFGHVTSSEKTSFAASAFSAVAPGPLAKTSAKPPRVETSDAHMPRFSLLRSASTGSVTGAVAASSTMKKAGSDRDLPRFSVKKVNIPTKVWFPGSQEKLDITKLETPDLPNFKDLPNVWSPSRGGSTSPSPGKKEYKKIDYEGSPIPRRPSRDKVVSPRPEESFAWKDKETVKLLTSSGLPKVQSPTVTLLQKRREGLIPSRKPDYLRSDDTLYKPDDKLYTIKREYESEDEGGSRRFAILGPRKIEGVGPTTRDGVPVTLKSGVKSEHQGEWYRKMFDSLHKVKDETRRTKYGHYGGYLSEPDGYDSDFGSSSRNTKRYVHQPGRIEDYIPGFSSLSEKELKENPNTDVKIEIKSQEPARGSSSYSRFSARDRVPVTNAHKESGYESDSTLVFRKQESQRQHYFDPKKTSQVYRQIQRGGEIPLEGLQKPLPQKLKASPHKYDHSEVNIHYRTPVRVEHKETLSEEELQRRQEEHMKRVYEEERRKKYLAELEDIERRRHTDHFTPLQKSPIPLNRYDDDVMYRRGIKTPDTKQVARALFNFSAQNKRELTFNRGDLVTIRRQIDKNWYEGELKGVVGIFPCNYVEVIPLDSLKVGAPRRATEGQARARFNFQAQSALELSLSKGDLVVLTRRVDENWYEGRHGARKGIFPVSYVDTLIEPGGDRAASPCGSPLPRPALPAAHLLYNGTSSASTPYSSLGRPGSQSDRTMNPLVINTQQDSAPYKALYNYKPQNEDELELIEGDIVNVMEKCDDGWFVGTSRRTGLFGTFPGNYVEKV